MQEPNSDHRVTLNWYPKVKAVRARGIAVEEDQAELNNAKLTKEHVALLDLDAVFFEMLRFKAERGWNNLNITRGGIRDLLANNEWYSLQIPASEMAFDSFERVRLWQELAISLLKKYCERYYTFRKREWELPHLEYQSLSPEDPNFTGYSDGDEEHFYRVLVDQSRDDIIADIERLKEAIESKDLTKAQFGPVSVLWFDQHLYEPLLHLAGGGEVIIKPISLNAGERRFVESLQKYWARHSEEYDGKELYLLRNRSQGGGVGFFEAGNFHPDFMLWIAEGDRQRIIFIDPKGLLNVGPEDPKIRFCETIKEIETRLADESILLDSFIISTTPASLVRNRWGKTDDWLASRHIVFSEFEDEYIKLLLKNPDHSAS